MIVNYCLLVVASYCIVPLLAESQNRFRNFILTAPSRFGSQEVVCISLTSVQANVSVALYDLKTDDLLSPTYEKQVSGLYHCFKIEVDILPSAPTTARLLVKVSLTEGGEVINAVRNVIVMPDPLLTFIATNKPSYGPKDLIQIRVFAVAADFLSAIDKNIKIWLENPQGVHVANWRDIEHTGGFIDVSYQLIANPYPGNWTVKAKIRDQEYSRDFLVQRQAQTTFDVQVKAPETAEENSNISISVCARYQFGKPVSGSVLLSVTIECPFVYYCSENPSVSSVSHLLDSKGCAKMSILLEEGKHSVWRKILVSASVEEEGTNQVQNGTKRVTIIPALSFNSVASEFKLRTRRIKPGLPFEGKLVLSLQQKPVPDTDVTFCANLEKGNFCQVGRTNNGTVPFVILRHPTAKLDESLLIEASWTFNNSNKAKKLLYLQPWYSPSAAYLEIKVLSTLLSAPCDKPLKIQMLHTMMADNPFYVIVKSRGSIVLFDQIESMAELEITDVKFEADDDAVVISEGDGFMKSVTFSLPVDRAWSPLIYITVYTVFDNSDVVADSMAVPVEECFPYDVLAAWNTDEALPGSEVELKINSDLQSTCGVTVTDRKVEMLNQHAPNLRHQVFQKLLELTHSDLRKIKGIDSHRCINESADKFSSANSLSVMPESTSAYADSVDAFEDSGIVAFSDLPMAVKPCRVPVSVDPRGGGDGLDAQGALSATDVEEVDVNTLPESDRALYEDNSILTYASDVTMRSDFRDTWIFGLYDVKNSGFKVKATLPDSLTEWTAYVTCLSRNAGLSVAKPAIVRSYQPFFVDFLLPPSVKRHELLNLPISVFNYLDSPVPVMVSIEPSEHFHIKGELSHTVCVESGSKVTKPFRVLAVKLGAANISVKAEVDPFSAEECGPPLNDYKVDYIMKETTVRGDGRRLEEVRSALICGTDTRVGYASYPSSVDWTVKMATPDYVDRTVNSEVRVSGDIFGPPLLNVEKFINHPVGCGEQNMLSFAANLLLVKYLLARHGVSEVEAHVTRALKNLESGYQQQLSFRHPDGSYSAFGPGNSNSSIWLTSFVVRYFTEAKLYVMLDEEDLNESVEWLKKQQMENGCFPMIGDVYNWGSKLRLAVSDSPKALTSYILISILKGNISSSLSLSKNAVFCLQASDVEDTYTDLLTVYALALANETREATSRMKGLLQTAQRSYQMLWWHSSDNSATELSIEMTSYGVLTLLHLGGPHFLAAAADAVRWLLQYQNQNGGFLSSQDTVLALEALAVYSNLFPRQVDSLTVSLSYQGENRMFHINEHNQLIQQVANIPPFLTNIHFEINGSGCALVQSVLGYNVRRGVRSKSLKLRLNVEPISSVDGTIRRVEACVKAKASAAAIGMAVIEVMLPTGYFPDRTSLYQITAAQNGVSKWEEYEDSVNFYLENLSHHKKCIMFLIRREVCVDNPASIIAKVYDYYNFHQSTVVKHNLQQSCNSTDNNWLVSENVISAINPRYRRNTGPVQSIKDESSFSNFMEVDQDLDVPTDNGNPVQIFALPPPPIKEGSKCPQCFAAPQEIFPKLYCSSKMAAQIRIRGPHLLDVLQDLSTGRTSNEIRRTIAYTMKRRCQCDIAESEDATAFLMVTPPRSFNLRTVQVIHLDDSFAIYPWNTTSQYQNTYFNISFNCNEMLSVVR